MNKYKMRLVLYSISFLFLVGLMTLSCFATWQKIYNNKKEKERLDSLYTSLLSEEANLEDDVRKLQDPEYVAKYAREKYLYTKDGEYVIDLSDLNKQFEKYHFMWYYLFAWGRNLVSTDYGFDLVAGSSYALNSNNLKLTDKGFNFSPVFA